MGQLMQGQVVLWRTWWFMWEPWKTVSRDGVGAYGCLLAAELGDGLWLSEGAVRPLVTVSSPLHGSLRPA